MYRGAGDDVSVRSLCSFGPRQMVVAAIPLEHEVAILEDGRLVTVLRRAQVRVGHLEPLLPLSLFGIGDGAGQVVDLILVRNLDKRPIGFDHLQSSHQRSNHGRGSLLPIGK